MSSLNNNKKVDQMDTNGAGGIRKGGSGIVKHGGTDEF